MKSVTLLALPVALSLMLAACSSNATVSDDVVASVNGKQITTAELEKAYQGRINGAQQLPTPEEAQALKFQLLTQMINDEILLQMASANNLNATDAEVETKFTDLKSQYTEEKFQEMLKEQKMTPDDIKGEMRKGLTVEKLITKEITNRINVSDAEIKDLFEKNKSSFNLPEMYHLQHILVTPVPELQIANAKRDDAKTPGDARAKAERVFRDIQGGQDFGLVARDWSEDSETAPNGGSLGFQPLSKMEEIDPKVSQAVQRLKIGESSPLIETRYGYHLLKLLERTPAGQKDLTSPQVEAQIRQVIFQRKEEMLRAAFSETARNNAQIKNHLAERLLESVGKANTAAGGASGGTEAKKEEPKDEKKAEEKK